MQTYLTSPNIFSRSWEPDPRARWYKTSSFISWMWGFISLTSSPLSLLEYAFKNVTFITQFLFEKLTIYENHFSLKTHSEYCYGTTLKLINVFPQKINNPLVLTEYFSQLAQKATWLDWAEVKIPWNRSRSTMRCQILLYYYANWVFDSLKLYYDYDSIGIVTHMTHFYVFHVN